MAVQDQKRRTGVSCSGRRQEPRTPGRSVAVIGDNPQLAAGSEGRDEVDSEPIAGGGHHERLADRRPGGPRVVLPSALRPRR
jgi:hypothetical protein